MAVTRLFGAAVKRREDPRLITGQGMFTDDLKLPGMLHMAIMRSPYAHARISRLDVTKAQLHPGVRAVYTGNDLQGKVQPMPCAWQPPNSDFKLPSYSAMATDRVRFTGDPVAVVVADDPYTARDALDLIDADYEPLSVVTNQEQAIAPGAPQLYDNLSDNVAFRWHLEGGDAESALRDAEVVIRQRFVQQRLIPNAMEPRSALAYWNPGSNELTIYNTTQNPHILRFHIAAEHGIPENKVRVIARDVGGGFGSKIPIYAGEYLAIFATRQLGLPVKWTEDRRENFVATIHGRDQIHDVELAAKRDGSITGLRVKSLANMGAYLSLAGPGVPTWLFGPIVPGCYTIQNFACDVTGVMTNTSPVDAYRGAGRPEAMYLIERMVDLLARELQMDPVEIRRKNFIPSSAFPYKNAAGLEYDSGNYEGTLDKALEMLDYGAFRRQQEELRKQGRYLGIGLSTYVEVCGLGPSPIAGPVMGFIGGLWEPATVRVLTSGKVVVLTGTNPHGQGEETTFAQLVAEEIGVPVEDVDVIHGDTGDTPMGWGTYGSRSTAVGGTAIYKATQKVVDKAKKIAAHMLEASAEDIIHDHGRYAVAGSPGKAVTIQDVALQANLAWNLPEGVTPGLEESQFHDPANFTFPFGAHICAVEVNTETGATKILRYIAVDDVGRVINPMIVEGQVHGGVAQGIGQALYEHAIYDEAGNLITGSMMDYVVPNATQIPVLETARTETPCPHNLTGVKGVGETGTIASSQAVVNAVCDALAPFGIKHIDMPLTPERIWRTVRSAGASAGATPPTAPEGAGQ